MGSSEFRLGALFFISGAKVSQGEVRLAGMGNKGEAKSKDAEVRPSSREKRLAKKVAKIEATQARLDDYFDDNAVRGEDNLRQLKELNPSAGPKQLNLMLQNEFVTAYCEANTDRQKRIAIEVFVLTSIELYGVSDFEHIREAILQMEKSIRAIGLAKFAAFGKKLVGPAIEVGLMVVTKKAPKGSRLGKIAKVAAVGAPIVQVAVDNRPGKSEAQAEQDENQAYKVIDRIRPVLGKLPKTWGKS